ncbi:MAG: bacteriohemerythrin [Humidesulfovibrio sp.]|jgi:hemerythrin-like metal-binding protein|uniref:bacteriohemerythrin n=1 Tax=Humidesulfovibrio sp. TaxID=2910988 RepID=UPI00273260C6|nr:bacteriohemerythrin [Humidesulfovibrio sp.]MDP2848764.1 bacteriohemerythrin [Humidesulfovibrio sp.]
MSELMWSSKLETGVPEIDDQHKKLIEIANNVIAAVREKLGTLGVDEFVQELREYTIVHFREEEERMEKLRYPEHGAHHTEHERLKHQVKLWQRELYHQERVTVDEVREFLRGWLIDHILQSDMAFKDWLLENATCTLSDKGTKCSKSKG